MLGICLRAGRGLYTRQYAASGLRSVNSPHILGARLPVSRTLSRGLSQDSVQPSESDRSSQLLDDVTGTNSDPTNISEEIASYLLQPDTLSSLGLLSTTPAGFYRWIVSQIHFLEPTLPWSCTIILAFLVIRMMYTSVTILLHRIRAAEDHTQVQRDEMDTYLKRAEKTHLKELSPKAIKNLKRFFNAELLRSVGLRNPFRQIGIARLGKLFLEIPLKYGAYVGVYGMCSSPVPQLRFNTGLEWLGITDLTAGDPTGLLGILWGYTTYRHVLSNSQYVVLRGKALRQEDSFIYQTAHFSASEGYALQRWTIPAILGMVSYFFQIPVGLLLVLATGEATTALIQNLLIHSQSLQRKYGILSYSFVANTKPILEESLEGKTKEHMRTKQDKGKHKKDVRKKL